MKKGLYIAYDESPVWGFSVGLVYDTEHKDLQLAIMLFNIMVAIGYSF